ncbi:MAG: hypothetical protein L7H18_05010 [Candidatus Nealsonbacteria bacterium DGGOD1a]|nr:MAG: hypothetical protein L7H18_05010 [Candidatus Nealsonbacteria bacterium DGGOD1a]
MKLVWVMLPFVMLMLCSATTVDYSNIERGPLIETHKIKLENGPINLSFDLGDEVVTSLGHYTSKNKITGNADARTVIFRDDVNRVIGDVEILVYDRLIDDPVLVDEQCMEKLVEVAGGKDISVNVTNILFAGQFPAVKHLVSRDPWLNQPGYYVSIKVAKNVMVNVLGDPDSFERMNQTMEFGGVDL